MNRTFCFMIVDRSCPLRFCFSLVDKHRDSLGERLGWLRVKAPSKFARIAMQSFASFLNKLLQLHKFVVERLIAAFSVEASQKERKIVGASEQFTQRLCVGGNFLENQPIKRPQNAQLIPQLFNAHPPNMKTFRVAFLKRFGQPVLSAPVTLRDDATYLLPRNIR